MSLRLLAALAVLALLLIVPGGLHAQVPTAPPSTTLSSPDAGTRFGYSVAGAGDVNGDGFADVLVGAPYAAPVGFVHIYHGSPTGIGTTPTTVLLGGAGDDFFGWTVAGAGDVNGDGFADVIIGAPGADGSDRDRGQALVYHGSRVGIIATPATVITGRDTSDRLGLSVAGAGDVNADGFADVIIGADRAEGGGRDRGEAYVHHGGFAGINPAPATIITGFADADNLGTSVAGAGDVNGDGFADVLVGAPYAAPDATLNGQVYLHRGSFAGVELEAFSVVTGSVPAGFFGLSVAGIGDANSDGFADVLVGAPNATGTGSVGGAAYVLYGRVTGLPPQPDDVLTTDTPGAGLGSSVAGAGDVDGDGFADVVLGAPSAAAGGTNRGQGLVFRTTANDGVAALPFALLTGGNDGDNLGFSVAGAGDVNGDGFADVVLGAPAIAPAVPSGGQVQVVYGTAGQSTRQPIGQRRSE